MIETGNLPLYGKTWGDFFYIFVPIFLFPSVWAKATPFDSTLLRSFCCCCSCCCCISCWINEKVNNLHSCVGFQNFMFRVFLCLSRKFQNDSKLHSLRRTIIPKSWISKQDCFIFLINRQIQNQNLFRVRCFFVSSQTNQDFCHFLPQWLFFAQSL